MANLYVDEDLANLAPQLRQSGHNVRLAVEAGAGLTDAWHLQQASVENRILVTFNDRDYRFLHRVLTTLWVFQAFRGRHAGILTSTRQLEATAWLPALNDVLARESELGGRMLTWHPSTSEWREDDWRPVA